MYILIKVSMIVQLCIIVYDRLENIEHWLKCLEKCVLTDTVVNIIHNVDKKDNEVIFPDSKVKFVYIQRQNIGFDMGAFQDICKSRLKGFAENWDRLLWIADDTFPMSYDFIEKFNNAMKPGIGVACMQISPYVRTHIRTTGFMIDRKTAERLKFPVETITTKEHCYQFEHRHITKTFYNQVKAMGLLVVQVAPNDISPLWDIGYKRKLNRQEEHEKLFGAAQIEELKPEHVTFVCPIYKSYPAVITSLIMQTNPNWKLKLIHDGKPEDTFIQDYINRMDDSRIEYIETDKHYGSWGHQIRADYLQKVDSKYVVITNPDNYYTPVFIEYCLRAFNVNNGTTVAAYSQQIAHSYKAWGILNCRVERGYIDCGSVMLKTAEVAKVGWKEIKDHSSDWFFFNDIYKTYGVKSFVPVPGLLFIHN